MRYIAVYGAAASIILIGLTVLSKRHYRRAADVYNGDPSTVNESKRKSSWKLTNLLCIISLAPFIVTIFLSSASPLIKLKQYFPMATAAGLVIAALLAVGKNQDWVLPKLREPSQKEAGKQFFFSFLKGSLLILFLTTLVFFVTDESYRQQAIDRGLRSVTPDSSQSKTH
jgi:hypothetical protein